MSSSQFDPTLASVTASALGCGKTMHGWSLLLAAATLLMLVIGNAAPLSFALCLLSLSAALVETLFAARVSFDAALFSTLASDASLEALDHALAILGFRKPPQAPRDLADRAKGALRLMYKQAGCLILQLAFLLTALFLR